MQHLSRIQQVFFTPRPKRVDIDWWDDHGTNNDKPMTGWWLSPTPLKNDGVRQMGWFFPIYGKIKFMFQTTHQPDEVLPCMTTLLVDAMLFMISKWLVNRMFGKGFTTGIRLDHLINMLPLMFARTFDGHLDRFSWLIITHHYSILIYINPIKSDIVNVCTATAQPVLHRVLLPRAYVLQAFLDHQKTLSRHRHAI